MSEKEKPQRYIMKRGQAWDTKKKIFVPNTKGKSKIILQVIIMELNKLDP